MLQLSRWKLAVVILATLFGILFTLPNVLPASTRAALPGWVPKQTMNLGLDLQGGSYLLFEVDIAAMKRERVGNVLEDVRTDLREKQIRFANLAQVNDEVRVSIVDPVQTETAYRELQKSLPRLPDGSQEFSIARSGDLLTMSMTDAAIAQQSVQAVKQSIETIRRRIDSLGTREPSITQQGNNRIVVQAPGESDPEKLKSVIGQTAKLSFHAVDESVTPDQATAGAIPPGSMLVEGDASGPVVVRRRSIVSGEMLTNAQATFDQQNQPAVAITFNGAGARRFGQYTSQNVGKSFAIVLDNKVISLANIIEPIPSGNGQISNMGSVERATELSLLLRSGALPAPLKVEEQRSVGAELGADAVRAGQMSVLIGAVATLVFIICAYGLFGGFATIALAINGLMIVAFMTLFQATLTLPGIAGLVLTLAVAVDANVLIYERMRDEARAGRSAIASADAGFSRAMATIIDANLTTLIAALIMFQFGSGPVRGFAWTLSIGVLTSVFTSVLVTQVLVALWFRWFKPKALPMADGVRPRWWPAIKLLPIKTNFRFARYARLLGAMSLVAAIGSIVLCINPGLVRGIDFKGGTVIELNSGARPLNLSALRSTVDGLNLGEVQVQSFATPKDPQALHNASLRFQTPDDSDPATTVTRVKAAVAQAVGDVEFTRSDVVGPKVSSELFRSGLTALAAAIVLMLIYIWFRFELQFGIGAVVGLFHDVILTFGMIALFRLEFSLNTVAAILTVIGYSMNDTVVVFDRIRENLRKFKKLPLSEVIDLSINETLSRTVITGLTGMMALLGLAIFGGDALRGFSLVLMFGIVVGTYSSIYICAPTILLLGVKRGEEPEVIKPQPSRV